METDPTIVLARRVIVAVVAFAVTVPALSVWLLLPPVMPHVAPPLPPLVRDALRVEAPYPEAWLSRLHLADLRNRGLLPHERNSRPVLREMVLTFWLKAFWSRNDLLDALGAAVSTGAPQDGLPAGAEYYFGRPLASLPPAEVATLVAVLRSPRALEPACHPARAMSARTATIVRLQSAGVLTPAEADAAKVTPLTTLNECVASSGSADSQWGRTSRPPLRASPMPSSRP
jgi:hypothetical protein